MRAEVDARHQSCLDSASRYLGYRPRSELEVKRYLKQKGFDDSAIAEVLAELRREETTGRLCLCPILEGESRIIQPS